MGDADSEQVRRRKGEKNLERGVKSARNRQGGSGPDRRDPVVVRAQPSFVRGFPDGQPPGPRFGGGCEALGGGAACAGLASRRTVGRLGSSERARRGARRRRGVGPREKEIASRGNGPNPGGASPFPSREARGVGELTGEVRPQVSEWRRRDGPVRPVSKHGPRSLTRARARGREAHPRNESEWRDALPEGGRRRRPDVLEADRAGALASGPERW